MVLLPVVADTHTQIPKPKRRRPFLGSLLLIRISRQTATSRGLFTRKAPGGGLSIAMSICQSYRISLAFHLSPVLRTAHYTPVIYLFASLLQFPSFHRTSVLSGPDWPCTNPHRLRNWPIYGHPDVPFHDSRSTSALPNHMPRKTPRTPFKAGSSLSY